QFEVIAVAVHADVSKPQMPGDLSRRAASVADVEHRAGDGFCRWAVAGLAVSVDGRDLDVPLRIPVADHHAGVTVIGTVGIVRDATDLCVIARSRRLPLRRHHWCPALAALGAATGR